MLKQQFPDINDGISKKDRQAIGEGLTKLLADTFSLYLKTHNFHWNVTGSLFRSLHLMFEEQYNEIFLAVDLIAERLRALGFLVPATYSDFIKLTKIKEHSGDIGAEAMVKNLIESHETLIKTARAILPAAEKADDQVTQDLITQRLQIHEKNCWMLRSIIK